MVTVEQLQAALAGEHAAVYAYGLAGARLNGGQRATALRELDAHRSAREALATRVRAAGGEPVGQRPAYAVPFDVRDAGSARRLLGLVESRLADLYGDLVAGGDTGTRRADAAALTGCAVRAATWSARAEPFPGFVQPPARAPR